MTEELARPPIHSSLKSSSVKQKQKKDSTGSIIVQKQKPAGELQMLAAKEGIPKLCVKPKTVEATVSTLQKPKIRPRPRQLPLTANPKAKAVIYNKPPEVSPYVLVNIPEEMANEHASFLPFPQRDLWLKIYNASKTYDLARKENINAVDVTILGQMFRTIYNQLLADKSMCPLDTRAMMILLGRNIINAKATEGIPAYHVTLARLLLKMSYWCCLSHCRSEECTMLKLYKTLSVNLHNGLLGLSVTGNAESDYWKNIIALVNVMDSENRDFLSTVKDLARTCVLVGVNIPKYVNTNE